jgi:hypothetical protein
MPSVSQNGVHKEKPNTIRDAPNGFARRKALKTGEIGSSSTILPVGDPEALALIN